MPVLSCAGFCARVGNIVTPPVTLLEVPSYSLRQTDIRTDDAPGKSAKTALRLTETIFVLCLTELFLYSVHPTWTWTSLACC